jgi:hypothetical protein
VSACAVRRNHSEAMRWDRCWRMAFLAVALTRPRGRKGQAIPCFSVLSTFLFTGLPIAAHREKQKAWPAPLHEFPQLGVNTSSHLARSRVRWPYNRAVSDVLMPKLGGIELCEQILRERPAMKVLLVSGTVEQPPEGVEFLRKPFRAAILAQQVRRLLSAGSPASRF